MPPHDFMGDPYAPTPPLPGWSDMRLLAIEICNLIPEKHWAEYGNVAASYNDTVRLLGLGYGEQNAHTFGLLIDDHDERGDGRLSGWTVPWHRIRDRDGLCRAKYRGKVYDPEDYGNVAWRNEGGRLIGASAVPSQQIDLRLALKRGEITRPGNGGA